MFAYNFPARSTQSKHDCYICVQVILGSRELIDLNLGVGEAAYLLRQATQEETCYQVNGEKPGKLKPVYTLGNQ